VNIRTAILKAADHIERNPKQFDYASVWQPDAPNCGTPGCALGWIASFAKYKSSNKTFGCVARDLLGLLDDYGDGGDDAFYKRMGGIDEDWNRNARICAATLREYADKYHPKKTKRKTKQGKPA
jgi:hypothetical protein